MDPGADLPTQARERMLAALDADDVDAIALLLRDQNWPLFGESPELVNAGFARLPPEVVGRHPALRLAATIGGLADPAAPAPSTIVLPEELEGLTDLQKAWVAFDQMLLARLTGEYAEALEHAGRVRSLLSKPRALHAPFRYDTVPLLYTYIGISELLGGSSARALADFRQARRLAVPDGGDPTGRSAAGHAAVAAALRGSLDDADELLASARALPPATPSTRAIIERAERVAGALIAVERCRADAADLVEHSPVATEDAADELWPLGLLAAGRFQLSHHRPARTLELLAAHDGRPTPDRSLAADIVASLTIDAYCALGDLAAARASAGTGPVGIHTQVSRVRLLLRSDEPRQASLMARQLIGDPGLPLAQRSESLLLDAWATVIEDGGVDAHTALSLSRLATHSGLIRIFAAVPGSVHAAISQQLPEDVRSALASAVAAVAPAPEQRKRPRLSPRELSVLRALADHASSAEIAQALFVSPNTVKTQLRSVYRKLGVGSRDEALAEARRLRLLAP